MKMVSLCKSCAFLIGEKMIPIFICDDQEPTLKKITAIVKNQILIENLDMGPVFSTTTPDSLLEECAAQTSSCIYFLDVDLSEEIDGFQLASRIRELDPRGYIVFITGHSERSVETFRYRLEAMDYIVKGNEDELTRRIRECLQIIEKRILSENDGQKKFYTLKIFDTVRYIPLDEILYFESEGVSHRIYLHTEKEELDFLGSLKSVEEELGNEFFRSHRSFLLNRNKIRSVELKKNQVELSDGTVCPLSRSAKKNFVQ